ncbi:DUF2637 domain-containing protein, partial [Streptomyces sp. NPDC002073]
PVLFVVTVEAARHAVGRIADITADRHMEGVRITRWLLSPIPTFKLWRRMKLWELRSYEQAVGMEQDRLIYQARLQARYGRAWRRKAPVEALMPLRLARIGVPLAQTGPSGLAAAGIEPLLLPPAVPAGSEAPALAALTAAAEAPTSALQVGDEPLVEDREGVPADVAGDESGAAVQQDDPVVGPVDWFEAGGEFIARYGQFPTAEQLAAFLAQVYGVIDPETSGLLADEVLEPVLADLRVAVFGAIDDTAHEAGAEPGEAASEVGETPVAAVNEATAAPSEAHPFFGKPAAEPVLVEEPARSEPVTREPVAAPSATATGTMTHAASDGKWSGDTLASALESQAPLWTAEVTDTGAATARVPQQQSAEAEADPIQKQIELVAKWLAEAEDAGKKLSGAEAARRLKVSAKTGQRRIIEAAKYLEEQRQRQGRAHLRSVSS